VGQLAREFDTTRIGVMHHLRQLEEAQLILSEKVGRTRHLYHNPVPIQLIYDRWTTEYAGFWASRMADIKYNVEGTSPGAADGRNRQVRVKDRDSGKHRGRVA
jgi:predicted transcriptional regulator